VPHHLHLISFVLVPKRGGYDSGVAVYRAR
jgi:hypothetical protein